MQGCTCLWEVQQACRLHGHSLTSCTRGEQGCSHHQQRQRPCSRCGCRACGCCLQHGGARANASAPERPQLHDSSRRGADAQKWDRWVYSRYQGGISSTRRRYRARPAAQSEFACIYGCGQVCELRSWSPHATLHSLAQPCPSPPLPPAAAPASRHLRSLLGPAGLAQQACDAAPPRSSNSNSLRTRVC